jgi:hypothetical protein
MEASMDKYWVYFLKDGFKLAGSGILKITSFKNKDVCLPDGPVLTDCGILLHSFQEDYRGKLIGERVLPDELTKFKAEAKLNVPEESASIDEF